MMALRFFHTCRYLMPFYTIDAMDTGYQALQDTYYKLYQEYDAAVAEMLRQVQDPACDAAEFAHTSHLVSLKAEQLASIRAAMKELHSRRGGVSGFSDRA
jgi:hypothetical protein